MIIEPTLIRGAGRPLVLLLACCLATLPVASLAQTGTSPSGVQTLLEQAEALGAEQPEAAIGLLESARENATAEQQGPVLIALAQLLVKHEQSERAFALLTPIEADSIDDLEVRAQLLKLRIGIGTSLRKFDPIERNRADIEALPADALEPETLAGLWHQQLVAHYRRGQPAEAESAARRALEALGDRLVPLRSTLHELLGVALAQQGKLPDAIEAMIEAERLSGEMGQPLTADFLVNSGGLFIYAQDWPRAIDYLTRALAIQQEHGAPPAQLTRTLSNLGVAYNGAGDLAAATRHFESALTVSRDSGLRVGSAVNNLAYALREQGRLDEALALFQEALEVGESNPDPELVAVAHKNLGETLVRMGRREQASMHLEQAYQAYLKADVRPKRLELYPVLVENLEALGRTGEALAMMREFKQLSDETINVESNERIAKLESAIDLARKEQELVLSQAERMRQQIELEALAVDRHRQRLLAVGLAAGLAVLVLVALLLYRQVRFKTRANRLLEQKNAEIQAQHARLAELNEAIRLASLRDALTGLPNRRFLDQHMREIDSVTAPPDIASGLLLMIDIDHFKQLNDSLGHLAGDQALIHVAQALERCRQPQDVLVRWGGEEFLWLAHGAGLEQAGSLCRRVQHELHRHPFALDGEAYPITVSIGFAPRPLWQLDTCDWTLSLRVADDALYLAKRSGRNRWVGFAPGTPPTLPLGQGAVASALESTGHLIRIEDPASTPPETKSAA